MSSQDWDAQKDVCENKEEDILDTGPQVELEGKEFSTADYSRLMNLMQGLQRVARLQEELTNTQIDFRQKRREAAFKREAVWNSDARFMRKLQQLIAHGRQDLQEDFQRLQQLAAECQAARDDLGPIEHEGIEAEQRWEGQIWSLQQAENQVYHQFSREFQTARRYPPAPPSLDSSQYESLSDSESQMDEGSPVVNESPVLATIDGQRAAVQRAPFSDVEQPRHHSHEISDLSLGLLNLEPRDEDNLPIEIASEIWGSDSAFRDIDQIPETLENENFMGASVQPPARQYPSDLYTHLHTDFSTKRDRINKWLEDRVLTSRIEATSLFTMLSDQLGSENKILPSNWAQLVIAYWELDGATMPQAEVQQMHGN